MQILSFLVMGLFMLVAISILFGSHFLVYISVVKFFKITFFSTKATIAGILFFLGVSFIAASILAHWKETGFTRDFYFLSSLWMGIMANLFVGFVFAWVIIWIAKVAGFDPSRTVLGVLVLLLTSLVSGYGVWNAMNPKIKNITVKMKNLPIEWQGKTVIQISDVHLGHIFDQEFLQRLVDMANLTAPSAVFITGDLFDGMDGDFNLQTKPLDDIKTSHGVYFITGNHETYFGVDRVKDILSKTRVRVLDDEMVVIDGLQILGISYPPREGMKDMKETLAKMAGFEKVKPSILLYHSPTHVDEIKASGINLQLAGHTHKGQIFPFNFITHLIYRGYDYGLHEEGDFSIYTTNGAGAWGPTMRTGNTPEIVAIKLENK